MFEYLWISLLIPLIAGILVYTDAKNRGESEDSAFIWGLFVFLILIIGLPLYYIMVVRKPRAEKQITRICPQCGRDLSSLPNDIRSCPYCGKTFEIKHLITKRCPYCGTTIKAEADYCPKCGKKIEE